MYLILLESAFSKLFIYIYERVEKFEPDSSSVAREKVPYTIDPLDMLTSVLEYLRYWLFYR